MPYLRVQTNVEVGKADEQAVLARLSQQLSALLGKSEQYVMVALEPGVAMSFAGSPAPTAYLELKSLGLPGERTKELSAALCELIAAELAVPAARVYIEFSGPERHMWGWNGGTF